MSGSQPAQATMFDANDERFMTSALELAKQGQYTVHPNPMVGCVVVKDKQIVGQGWHEFAGGPHAEIRALEEAGERASGATLYVTLEPCSHTGRTPPCADSIIRSGVSRVVVSCEDPNPIVHGRGLRSLEQAGIKVSTGVCVDKACQLNRGFFKRMKTGMPFVSIKAASSLDGRIAMANGESQWISCSASREDAHRLRACASAVLTGAGTVKQDNPALSVRHVHTSRQPDRVVLDSRLSISPHAKIFDNTGHVYLFAASTAKIPRELAKKTNAEIVVCKHQKGYLDLTEVLKECAVREMNMILVEAGSRLGGQFLKERLVDELVLYLAPDFLGSDATPMFELPGIGRLADKFSMRVKHVECLDSDIKIILTPKSAHH